MYSFKVFYKTFNDFLTDLSSTFPEKKVDLDAYKLKYANCSELSEDRKVIINEILHPLRRFSKQILVCDETMFNMPVVMNGNIDLSAMWHTGLSEENQAAIWDYLEKLYIIGNIVLKPRKQDKFLKVVWKIKQKYGERSLIGGGEDGELNDDNIQNATEQLQSIFGGNPVLNDMVKDIAQNVGRALQDNDPSQMMMSLMSGDHSMFAPLLEDMTEKYGDQLRNQPISEEDLMARTQKMFQGIPGMPDMSQLMKMQQSQMQSMAQSMVPQRNNSSVQMELPPALEGIPAQPPQPQSVAPPQISKEEALQLALDSGFSEDEFNRFQAALGGWNSIQHDMWWPMMRSEFLSKEEWDDDMRGGLMMMCRDGLGGALDVILGEHDEWKKFKESVPPQAFSVPEKTVNELRDGSEKKN